MVAKAWDRCVFQVQDSVMCVIHGMVMTFDKKITYRFYSEISYLTMPALDRRLTVSGEVLALLLHKTQAGLAKRHLVVGKLDRKRPSQIRDF